jgi:MSHA biogenesis protein MshL
MKLKLSVLAAASTLLLGGCATSDFSQGTAHEKVQTRTSDAVKTFKSQEARVGEVNERNEQFVSFKSVKLARAEGTVTLKAAGAPVGPSISDVARQAGYSLVFAEGVDASRKVTAEFTKAQPEEVVRNLAFLAGYAAIFDRDNKTITIAQNATYTYKLPPAMFQQLGSQYTVGGNPVTQGGGSGSGGAQGGGGGSGSSGMQASFTITGRETTNSKGVEKLITDIAGKNAEVTVSEMGIITVRSNAQSLKRVTEFFKNFSKDALTQVEIEASIIEVTLSDDFQFGVDWKRVLGTKLFGSDTNVALNFSPTNIVNSTMQATFTTANITTVISSLRKLTDAKIISQPRILAMNNTPSNFFDGTQLPYLGTLTATTTGGVAGGGTQLSGTTSQAVDGISFSVQPSVIDDKHVQITLLPVLSSVQGFETFDLGESGKLTSPKQSTKQSFMKVMAQSGKTLILGGIRYSVDTKNTSAGPVPVIISGRDSQGTAKEVVILLRATVLPAPEYNPIVSESV